jgi:hypothetical protein
MAMTSEIMQANEEGVIEIVKELSDSYDSQTEFLAHLDKIHEQFVDSAVTVMPMFKSNSLTS